MIIDAHIHLFNPLHGKDAGVDREALSWGKAREGDRIYYATPPSFEDSLSTYERAMAHMDWLSVDRAVVLQEFMDGKQDEYLAEVREKHPDRFCCMALFDQHYYDDPLGCFEIAVEKYKLQGFLVITPGRFPEIAVPRLEPLWRTCAEKGLPVVLKNGGPDEIRRLIDMAPGLKIVMSHFAGSGGSQDEFRDRLEIAASCPTVYIDSGGMTHRHKYPFTDPKEKVRAAVETVGAGKIAWGSDYPRPGLVADASYRQQLEFITLECDFLSDTERESILSGTALEVYPWIDG